MGKPERLSVLRGVLTVTVLVSMAGRAQAADLRNDTDRAAGGMQARAPVVVQVDGIVATDSVRDLLRRSAPAERVRGGVQELALRSGEPARVGEPENANGGYTLIGWNNLGMHCLDRDFSVFAILPPYNGIDAQLFDPDGALITNPAGVTVTYQAVTDPSGSINTTSVGKTNFWDYVLALFGVSPAPDVGLTGVAMPGPGNVPQPMMFQGTYSWFDAEGIPLIPRDDMWRINYYPMMHLVARDSAGGRLASTDIVLPVSDEMTCTACHASGSDPAAMPTQGWLDLCDRERDYRLNILLLHDDRWLGQGTYQAALAAQGYSSEGLYATVTVDGTPILCAGCHGSNALPGTGYAGVPPLTESVHGGHATVIDPVTGLPLDASENRSACYRCHPGSQTRCLRGAMGNAVAADGSFEMQCQSCHGVMSTVGQAGRAGWLDEPRCQSCHTGTATHNNGQIRYTDAFDVDGQWRVAVDQTFATNDGAPAPGFSLYRFSKGHGDVMCEACHNSTHAVYPSRVANDNIQMMEIQGHTGTLVECTSCHMTQPATVNGGPHGMHPPGQEWTYNHSDAVEGGGAAQCQACHGLDYTGTVLSRAQSARTLSTPFGTKNLWRGYQIGCYTCHNGPSSESGNPNQPPAASSATVGILAGTTATLTLAASDPEGLPLQLRIVGQPSAGTVALSGSQATYTPSAVAVGTDTFTFAAWDGQLDSNLATITVNASSSFGDIPLTYWAGSWVERLYRDHVTAGCSASPLLFCPGTAVTRAQMAVFIEKAMRGQGFTPPPASGIFTDVPADYWAAAWIEQLFADQITSGCSQSPPRFCPETVVNRAQMAVFLIKARLGAGCSPPAATGGIFADVPAGYWAAPWIEQLVKDGVTAGCGGGNFCPEAPVTRDQMAVFLVKGFRLP